jgi:hypothetical protein
MSVFLGYKLFQLGIVQAQKGTVGIAGWKVQFVKVGPGIFFALFGMIGLVVAMSNSFTGTHETDGETVTISRSKFSEDQSSLSLERFLDPDGTGMRNPERVQAIIPFLTIIGLGARDITRFLNGADFAQQREFLANEFRKQGKL